MADFNLTKMAVNLYCPGNVVQQDEAGLPSIMVWIPAFKNSDVLTGGDDSVHPAFIVNDRQIPGFYYSKYENVVHNGKAYSLPAENPASMIRYDEALDLCESKGYGWHLCTNAEWAAIALWCMKNGFLPCGNNGYGKDGDESEYKAIPLTQDANGKTAKTATGTGPLTWSHDGTASGIWDLNGNLWEWQGGIRLVWGELQILANNDAADPDNPQNQTSTCWKAINAADGSLVDPECVMTDTACKTSGNTVKMDYVDNVLKYSTGITNDSTESRSCDFINIACGDEISDAAKVLLRALALLPDEGKNADDYKGDNVSFVNGATERSFVRGGTWYSGPYAGVFFFNAAIYRAATHEGYGLRAAYIPNI